LAYVIGIPALAILASLQASVFSRFRLLDGGPDLVLLVVIGWALTGQRRQSMTLGLIGGLLLDLLSGYPLGVTSVGLIVVAYLVSLSEGRFWEANFLMQLAAVLVGSAIYHLADLVVLLVLGRTPDFQYAVARVVLPSVFLNVVMALPIAQALGNLEETLYPPEVGI
jgi:rod shape-determining protein MreD